MFYLALQDQHTVSESENFVIYRHQNLVGGSLHRCLELTFDLSAADYL